jgi:hypothetical protein
MKLVPAMIGVENPRTGQADVLANGRGGQVATIARHELHNQVPTYVGGVHGVGQCAAGIQGNVQITVSLMAEPDNRP